MTLVANGAPSGSTVLWKATAGTHSLRAFVDDINRITGEASETNNTLTGSLTIR